MTPLKRLGAVLLALAFVASGTACSTRAPSDSIVLYYSAGAGDDRKFQECIEPGTSGSYPVDDEIYSLPTSTRTWNIRPEGGDTNKAIESGTKFGKDGQPGPAVQTYATADFYLNTDCKDKADSPIVKFWQQLGRRYDISTEGDEDGFKLDKFKQMLLNTFVPAEEKALAEGTRFYTADELDSNGKGQRAELEKRLSVLFAAELKAKLGGDFFCGVGFTRNPDGSVAEVEWTDYIADGEPTAEGVQKFREEKHKGKCPPVRISITDINFANADIAKARAAVYTAEQEAKAKLIAANAELEQSKILGQASSEAYLRYKAIEAQAKAAEACRANPNCTVIIGTNGVNVNTK